MTVTLTPSYKTFLKPEIVNLIDELVEDNYALDDILEFIDEHGEDNFEGYYVEYCEQGENSGYEVVDVFVKEYGFCDVDKVENAYAGTYHSVEDFVEELIEEQGGNIPDFVIVDLKETWSRSLSFDYDVVNDDNGMVHVFRRYY